MRKTSILLFFSILLVCPLHGQNNEKKNQPVNPHSVYTDPLLPFFKLVIVNYSYRFNEKDEVILGLTASRAETTPTKYLEYPGHVTSLGAITGYRRYLFKGLHADFWLMPAYSSAYERDENQYYKGFSLYNEFRLGYTFDIERFQIPLLLHLQWPLGFSLLDTNKPESFRELDRQDPLFYIFIPNIWFGFRF